MSSMQIMAQHFITGSPVVQNPMTDQATTTLHVAPEIAASFQG
jgi:hypothetical protein